MIDHNGIGTPQAERAGGKTALPWQLRQARGQFSLFFLAEMVSPAHDEQGLVERMCAPRRASASGEVDGDCTQQLG
ncbi:hypothetical protein BMJ32_31775 [Sinorhizobium medicae]|nr:hypothetical protein BMJ32_31775 [Sinorhizobium medicae]PLU56015.1 hypothetical protein BMJ23_15145 [Sinorhizobium medicae]PLU61709.1 hypothetical protein BMJ21_30865 [Sinorhizobium medicae]PLU83680.1 hypothetical protein BMJ22_02810 [Sinorhizobium medicae]RVI52595.1 hypothetical protein CN192_20545 [Sinorhizobium medicae]